MKPRRIAILGAGIGGLAAAYRLEREAERIGRTVEIDLFEKAPRVGGTIRTEHRDGFILEGGPDCFLSEKPDALRLAKEIGLESELIGTRPEFRRSFVLSKRALRPVPTGFYLMSPREVIPFLMSDLLSFKGKLRTLMEPFIPRGRVADESLGSFVRRRFGREMLETVAQPMVAGIYAADPDSLSLKATLPRFLEMEAKYGSVAMGLRKIPKTAGASGPRYGLFATLKSGMSGFADTLSKALKSTRIHVLAPVREVSASEGNTWKISAAHGAALTVDDLFAALPAHGAGSVLSGVSPTLATELGAIPYTSSATINLAYRENQIGNPLEGMGFVVPAKEGSPILGCSFTHRKFPGRAPEGFALLRAFVGGALNADALNLNDGDLIRSVQDELAQVLKIEGAPLFVSLARWERAMPQYTVGHLTRVERIDRETARLGTVHIVGGSLRGAGIPDIIANAEEAARRAVTRW